ANTHTAPATVVLVSTDVNFALELSDLRHRHGFHIILVHKNQASEALLHHANELIRFEEFISDLPPRLPVKMPCQTLLYVYNLPANKDGKSISNRLRRLSDNCGGKVLNITGCSAILRFINRDSAERALKRMENEDVFGNRIIVSFTPKSGELCETKSSNATADKAKSPKKLKNPKLCLIKDTSEPSSSAKAAPGKGSQANSGSATKNTNVKSLQELCRMESKTGTRSSEPQQGHLRPVAPPHRNSSAAAPTPKTSGVAESVYKTNPKKENLCTRSVTSSPVDKKDKEETLFQVSYPSAFSKLIASRQVGPLLTPQSWSSRSILLQTHEGTVPLLSFPDCYAAEFGELEVVQENRGGGVPLEHLITCVPGVNIATAQNGIKVVKWIHNKPPPPNTDPWLLRSKSPVGNPQLIQFSREVIDLLKSQPSCVIPISNFIPSYHHHFAKQCRVSDYGYSKLIELLEAVPHVLQILGMGSKRLLTLTHRAQVKRFTQDLLKLLKSQASKQVIVREFTQAYHWCFSKDWDVTEYGVCELIDIVSEIPDTTICLSQQDNEMVICIPKRERTQDETERTKQFSKDVVDLLRHQPHFRMPFNKFIPSYHHHFGRQCKLAYYGFTKLLELFEAIPDILQVLECGEEKILTLTEV
ncbi:hypothetical protein DBR06_SOUSAS140010001, partial [Sousa chinensis]